MDLATIAELRRLAQEMERTAAIANADVLNDFKRGVWLVARDQLGFALFENNRFFALLDLAEKQLRADEPEWESANQRTVKWDEEQTRYLRQRLADASPPAVPTMDAAEVAHLYNDGKGRAYSMDADAPVIVGGGE